MHTARHPCYEPDIACPENTRVYRCAQWPKSCTLGGRTLEPVVRRRSCRTMESQGYGLRESPSPKLLNLISTAASFALRS